MDGGPILHHVTPLLYPPINESDVGFRAAAKSSHTATTYDENGTRPAAPRYTLRWIAECKKTLPLPLPMPLPPKLVAVPFIHH